MAMKKMCLRKTVSFLLVLSMIMALAGCGSGDPTAPGSGMDTDSGIDGSGNMDPVSGDVGDAESDSTAAMGRYVETELDLTEFLANSDGNRGLRRRLDGSLVILSTIGGLVVSEDEGATWQAEAPDWFQAMKQEEKYIIDMDMAADGTTAVLYNSGGVEEYAPAMMLVLPDGTHVPVEVELTEEESSFSTLAVSEEGRIIVGTASETLYEIHTDGNAEKYLTVEERPQWMKIQDGLLFMDSEVGDMPVIYDMEAEAWVEDDVLQEFAAANYGDRYYNGYTFQNMYLLPGEEQTVYTIGGKGIHRHVIGGNMMEQIVDGSLSMLSNPQYYTISMMQLEGDAFLGLYTGNKLIRFTYDPDVPSVPEQVVKLYSLQENANIRQAVSRYQVQHPDVFVSYEVGMGSGDSVTREDAIKKLNTQIMAGEGPDLLVMDDLPFDSYVEKGMLADLTDYLAQYSAEEPLFDNVIEALKKDGKAYVAPATIGIPQIAAAAEGMENVKDLSDLADVMEQLRQEHPGESIMGIGGAAALLKRLAATSAPKWITADGSIDREVLQEYLEQCKRIYDIQMDSLDQEMVATYEERMGRLAEYYGVGMEQIDWEAYLDLMSYLGKEQHMMIGWMCAQYGYLELVSLSRNEASKDAKVIPMQGQCTKVFKPATMLAVSAASGQIDAAKDFMSTFLSAEVQSEYDGLPLNQNAFDIQFTPKEDIMGAEGEYTSLYTTDADGNGIGYTMYWPSDETIAAFKQELSELTTAYVPDQMLEGAVFKQGAGYMQGEQTIEQALDEIERAVAIYMAE